MTKYSRWRIIPRDGRIRGAGNHMVISVKDGVCVTPSMAVINGGGGD